MLRRNLEATSRILYQLRAQLTVSVLAFIALSGFLVAVLISGLLNPVAMPRQLGEIGIIALFFALLLVMLIYLMHGPYGRWILGLLLISALIGAWRATNDNHEIRLIADTAPASPVLESDFKAWLRSRGDRDRYETRRYPVYIVAAEGGGIYAAYHAAMVLARLQDQCPNFSQHVFAISSVSGGSLGAAVFGGLSEQMATNVSPEDCQKYITQGPFERLTDELLAEDHLSPTIWGRLFPDFLQRFIPYPLQSLDRARWLEGSFEYSWFRVMRSDYFDQPLLRRYQPDGATPALLMNTTEVFTGQRILLTGFPLDGEDADRLKTINTLINSNIWDLYQHRGGARCQVSLDISAGSGAFNSSTKLVDGGYFENSGVETALDLIHLLQPIAEAADERIAIRLIVMESAADDRPSQAFSELLSPFHTMMNTRVTRGTLARVPAWRELCKPCAPVMIVGDAVWRRPVRSVTPAEEPVIWHVLDGIRSPLPLGWHLERAAQDTIRAQVGGTADCMAATPGRGGGPPMFTALNNCAFSAA